MKLTRVLMIPVLAWLLAMAPVAIVSAQTPPIDVQEQSTSNRFPEGIQFTVRLASENEISSVRLRARVVPDRPTAYIRAECTAGRTPTCSATMGNNASSYMVPGAQVFYAWEIEDANGNQLETPETTVTYEDDRFDWQSVSEGNLTVYYYFGSEDSANNVLRTARETIDRISALERTSIDFPVKVWVYRTAAEMAPAVASSIGRGPNSSVRTLGEVGAADTALVSRDVDFLNIVRHELAHVVTGQATKSHINFPMWINEGISVYAQSEVLPDEKQAMDQAIRRDQMLPLVSLGSSVQGSAGTVSLFYGQAGSIIKYMVETYGDEKFADWIAAIRTNTVDNALQTVYGFDILELENGWRQSLGLPTIAGGSSPGASNPSSIPTLPPLGSNPSSGAQATPTVALTPAVSTEAEAEASEGSSSALTFFVGGVVALVLASGAGLLLLRRRGSAS